MPANHRVLVTGAAGWIGSTFARAAAEHYDLRLMVLAGDPAASEIADYGEIVEADLADIERLKEVCQGMQTVIHLAGDPNPNAAWSSLLPNNIVGTYNLMVAAKAAGCQRVIFASSIHAISGYPMEQQVRTSDPVNPGDLYGVSKCFGESLGRYMAEQEGLSVIAIRIGVFQKRDHEWISDELRFMNSFVSQRDLVHLLERCIEAEGIRFAIVHGLSANRFNRMDISDTCELLDYQPQDDFNTLNKDLKAFDFDVFDALNQTQSGYKSGIREDV